MGDHRELAMGVDETHHSSANKSCHTLRHANRRQNWKTTVLATAGKHSARHWKSRLLAPSIVRENQPSGSYREQAGGLRAAMLQDGSLWSHRQCSGIYTVNSGNNSDVSAHWPGEAHMSRGGLSQPFPTAVTTEHHLFNICKAIRLHQARLIDDP